MVISRIATAGVYEDCILQNMKGVQVPQAIAEVRQACRQKADEHTRTRVAQFGERIDPSLFKDAAAWEFDAPGFHAMRFTNTTSDSTVTYVRLSVIPAEADGKSCDPNKSRFFAYTITVKPGQSIRLIYPSGAEKTECVRAAGVLARGPRWTDVSFSSSAKPVEQDPLEGIQ
jgi:hypothetical protein